MCISVRVDFSARTGKTRRTRHDRLPWRGLGGVVRYGVGVEERVAAEGGSVPRNRIACSRLAWVRASGLSRSHRIVSSGCISDVGAFSLRPNNPVRRTQPLYFLPRSITDNKREHYARCQRARTRKPTYKRRTRKGWKRKRASDVRAFTESLTHWVKTWSLVETSRYTVVETSRFFIPTDHQPLFTLLSLEPAFF